VSKEPRVNPVYPESKDNVVSKVHRVSLVFLGR
jgi:hypothetical protein